MYGEVLSELSVESSVTADCGAPSGLSELSLYQDHPDEDDEILFPPIKRRKRGVPEFSIEELFLRQCERDCFKKLSQLDIENARRRFYELGSETQQNQWVIEYMRQHSDSASSVMYQVSGKSVCETCWRQVYGLRYNKFSVLKAKFANNVVQIVHGREGQECPRSQSVRAMSWMRSFFSKVGDNMPMNSSIHLPACLTKADVYSLAYNEGGLECCAVSTFYRLWTKEFPNVVIPKENRFTTCDVCAAIKEAREKTLNPNVRQWLGIILEKHMQLQRNEREKYAKHRRKSEKYPSMYLSLIIDGMDQEKTNIPHIISNPKVLAGGYTLETHITGVKCHGRGVTMFIDWRQYAHDTNMTMQLLFEIFSKYKDELPPTLYIQMDNTCRDNKNKYTLTFSALLVQIGIFRKVKIGFLPVGHTHEDIDQQFSCISRRLKHVNVLTIPELMQEVERSFSLTKPEVVLVNTVHNFKQWMAPYTPNIHDHLKAHQFKFVRGEKGTKMFYKEWSIDSLWCPEGGVDILASHESCQSPLGTPQVVPPLYDSEIVNKIEKTISKIAAYLHKADASKWWENWLLTAKSEDLNKTIPGHCQLELLPRNYCINPEQAQSAVSSGVDEFSGVEMFSPRKMDAEKESQFNVPYIGNISSKWVGEKGREEIVRESQEKNERLVSENLKREIRTLSRVCATALSKLGAQSSSDPDVMKAVSMCELHLPSTCKRPSLSEKLGELWKTEKETNDAVLDTKSLAVQVLGSNLVDTITEANRQPPDIYIGPPRGKTSIVHNRDILKELKIGSNVAISSDESFPIIACVVSLPPSLSLKSNIEVQLYQQERAPTKTKSRRGFYLINTFTQVIVSDIILYDFELNPKNKTLKKATLNELLKD